MALVSIGLSDSFQNFLPQQLSLHAKGILLVVLFLVFYQAGLRILTWLQVVMSLQLLTALFMYALPVFVMSGANVWAGTHITSGFFMAIILASNICLGFQIIIELGEEIKQPEKNIPLALLIGGAVILLIYLAIIFAYTSAIGPANAGQKIKLLDTARPYLGNLVIAFLQLGMISAGLTSYNGAAIALPREIFSMSRDFTLPKWLSKVNAQGNPTNAVTGFFGLVIAILSVGQLLDSAGIMKSFFADDVIEFYGFMTILGIMMLTLMLNAAAYRMADKYPQSYSRAYIRFSKAWLRFFIIVSSVFAIVLIAIICTKWLVPFLFLVFTLFVVVYYVLRKRYLQQKGIRIGRYYQPEGWQ